MPSWYSVQFAGCVNTTKLAGPPSCSATVPSTHFAIRAVRRSAWYGDPDSNSGTGSPTRRLNSRASPSGSLAPRRSAAPPNSSSSPAANTTDGTVTRDVVRATGSTPPPRLIAAAVNVVPTSIPTA